MMGSPPAPAWSVAIPLPDGRGRAHACIESWARGQSIPRDDIEVIVASNPDEVRLGTQTSELLAAHDRRVTVASSNLFELCGAAARAACGRTLVFTEARCVAEHHCLAELGAYLREAGLAGAALHSEGDSVHWLARLEERRFAEEMRERLRPGDWRKVNVRGFALDRDVYLAAGGFHHRYVHFAGWELAARLHQQGVRLGYAERAVVRRFDDAPDLASVRVGLHRFVEGECRFRLEHPGPETTAYFGALPHGEAPDRGFVGRMVSRALSRLRLRRAERKVLRWRDHPERCFRAFQAFNAEAVRASRAEVLAEVGS